MHQHLAAMAAVLAPAAAVAAQPTPIAEYFGFEAQRIIVVDKELGPVAVADMTDDGRPDVVVANNRKSRIEVHALRSKRRTAEEMERDYEVNELPPSPWYDRQEIVVRDRVGAIRPWDVDGDGLMDLVYLSGSPQAIVIMRQARPGEYEQASRRRMQDLTVGAEAMALANLDGDGRPELLAIVDGGLSSFAIGEDFTIGTPRQIGSSGDLTELRSADVDGDGREDIVGIGGGEAPLRIWLNHPGEGPGYELRFEMPGLQDVEAVRLADADRSLLATIESGTRRIVLHELVEQELAESAGRGVRDVQAEVGAFAGKPRQARAVAVADLDGDGREDLIVTDPGGNSVVVHLQREGRGLASGESFAAFASPSGVAVGPWETGDAVLFVMSETEAAVGVSRWSDDGRLGFPQPISLETGGATPVAMASLEYGGRPALAVVAKDRRNLTLELHRPSGEGTDAQTIELRGVTRAPKSILATDVDRDGDQDLLLLTPGEPMVMVQSEAGEEGVGPSSVLGRADMKQFGLVEQAGPDNSVILDVDGDGSEELLFAHQNFIRAARYDADRGWRVLEQFNVPDQNVSFAGLALLEGDGALRMAAADRAGKRLYIFEREEGRWSVTQRLRLLGFDLGSIVAGRFTGGDDQSVLAIGESGYGVVRLSGRRPLLEEVAVFRPDAENRLEHELASGDVNGDGYSDLVVLDAREQMLSILTVSGARRILPATEFKVFESRLFSRGDARQYEPSAVVVADLTGDARDDVLLLVHDRVLIYPQATERGREP